MNTDHAAVWIDHEQAKVFYVDADTFDAEKVLAPHHHTRRHPSGPAANDADHSTAEQHFFHEVARHLDRAAQILIVGPANAKLELMKHLRKHDPALAVKVVAVEPADHPSDGQLIAYVRRYFKPAAHAQTTL